MGNPFHYLYFEVVKKEGRERDRPLTKNHRTMQTVSRDEFSASVGTRDDTVVEIGDETIYFYHFVLQPVDHAIQYTQDMMFTHKHGEVDQFAVRNRDQVLLFKEDEADAAQDVVDGWF